MTKRAVRVALLMCDTPVPDVVAEYGIYIEIYKQWLLKSLASYPDKSIAQNTELIIDGYDVVNKNEYPPEDRLARGSENGYDAVMLTGSKHSAYDTTQPWITTLITFVQRIAAPSAPSSSSSSSSSQSGTGAEPGEREGAYQHLKIIGICFGHQIISIALGGQCQRGDNGWELGVYGCQLTEEGTRWFDWSHVGGEVEERVFLEQVHKDHVPSVPQGCELLLSTPRYPVHGYVRYLPSSTPASTINSSSPAAQSTAQIFTIQGHPEFNPDMVLRTINARVKMGIFDDEVAAEARRRAVGKGDGGEGFGRVGWTIWKVLLQPSSQS